jgi:DNA-binding PadR family transcriptional regulator
VRRSPVSTLGGAILGLLATAPRTGYELAQAMRAPIGYMWTAGHSQIYPELARLQAAGLVSAQVVDGPGPRDTKRYTITPEGRDALITWTDSPLTEVARSELMLRVRCLWLLPPERARRFLETQRRAHQEQAERYAWEEADFARLGRDVHDPGSPHFAQYATLQHGLIRIRSTLEWFDWLLDRLPRAARSTTGAQDG